MAINFPDSPSVGDEFTGGGFTWTWSGSSWDKIISVASGGENGFTLFAGDASQSTFELTAEQPAGFYLISSKLEDTTFDVYLIGSDGANVGYSNTRRIEASAAFDTIVLYSSAPSDVWTFEPEESSFATGTGLENTGSGPYLTTTNVQYLPNVDDVVVLTGGNFSSNSIVTFTGSDSLARTAKSVTVDSSTQITAVRPDDMPGEFSPYSVSVSNPDETDPSTNVNTLLDRVSTFIPEISSAIISSAWIGSSYSYQLQSTVGVGAEPLTYSILSGSLPTNMTLSDSGLISGQTGDGNNVAKTFTVQVVDSYGGTDTQEFTITSKTPVFTVATAPNSYRADEGFFAAAALTDGGYMFKGSFSSGGPSAGGHAITKFDGDKNWVWTKQQSYGYFGDSKIDMKSDSSGNVYYNVMGYYTGYFIKVDNDGNVVWSRQAGSRTHVSSNVNPDGYSVYVTHSYSYAPDKYYTIFDPNGEQIWTRRFRYSDHGYGGAHITPDSQYVYMGHNTTLIKYAIETQTLEWSKVYSSFGQHIVCVTSDASGNLFIGSGSTDSARITKVSGADGSVINAKVISLGSGRRQLQNIVVDDDGSVYASVSSDTTSGVVKFNNDLGVVWARSISSNQSITNGALDVDNGFVIVSGTTSGNEHPVAIWIPKSSGGPTSGTTAEIDGRTFTISTLSVGSETTGASDDSDRTSGNTTTYSSASLSYSDVTPTYSLATL